MQEASSFDSGLQVIITYIRQLTLPPLPATSLLSLYSPVLACVAAVVRSPPWLLAPADTISCRLNRAVMVRTLYCFILFPGCLYYMAGPALSSPLPSPVSLPPPSSSSPSRSAGGIKIKLPRTRAPVLHEGLGDARQELNFGRRIEPDGKYRVVISLWDDLLIYLSGEIVLLICW